MKQSGVPVLWTEAAFLLRDCPDLNALEVHRDLLAGKLQLWLAVDNPHGRPNAVILTQKRVYPPLKRTPKAGAPRKDDFPDRWNLPERHVLVIHLAAQASGGIDRSSIKAWIDAAATAIEAFARELRCTELRILCRSGWRPFARQKFGKGFDRITFLRDRLTLPQYRRKAKQLPIQFQGTTRRGVPL